MKSFISALLVTVLLFLCGCGIEQEQPVPIEDKKIKAIWIYYDELSMVDVHGGDAIIFTNKITEMLTNCKTKGFNTVFVQVRPFGDAFYRSKIFPWSEYLTGEQGKGVDYDPLEIMVAQAHKLNLSIHAWINPFRVSFSTEVEKLSVNNPARKWIENKNNSVVLLKNGIYYCPASIEAQRLIIDGVKEIVENYDVDGIHIDDYFYPSVDEQIDLFCYKSYKAHGGKQTLFDWRKNIISSFVQGLYDTIKTIDEKCVFSISPAGNIENNYNEQFADVKLWCSKQGFCDWIIPQVYYGFESSKLTFDVACSQWNNIKTSGSVKIIYGLAGYRVDGKGESDEWKSENIIRKQIDIIDKLENNDGISVFSYGSLFNNNKFEDFVLP